MNSCLNSLRDEVKDRFTTKLKGPKANVSQLMSMLEEELNLLRTSVDDNKKFGHQIYDMLFLLLTLAGEFNIDLDQEWQTGWIKKNKYTKGAT